MPTNSYRRMEATKMRGKPVGIVTLMAFVGLLQAGAAQDPTSQTLIPAIKAEGLRSSETPVLFHTLTDVFGSRLTGSPAHLEAARWAVERFGKWGLANPRKSPANVSLWLVTSGENPPNHI